MKPFKASGSSMARSISSIKHPCAGCKLLRRRCNPDCIFVPYFPSNVPEKFASVHKIFGASNVSKMLHVSPSYTLKWFPDIKSYNSILVNLCENNISLIFFPFFFLNISNRTLERTRGKMQ